MKRRMTITVAEPLLREAESVGKRLGARSRSAMVERALRLFVRASREASLEASLDAYYRGLTPADEATAIVRASRDRHAVDG